jgi:predicted secreted hydrolase
MSEPACPGRPCRSVVARGIRALVAGVALALAAVAPGATAAAEGGAAPGVLAQALGAADEAFARPHPDRVLRFPADHGAHPAFRTEWWYLTGHLWRDDGRAVAERGDPDFGVQFTVFRQAVADVPTAGAPALRTDQLWMGHAALSDVRSQNHSAEERLQRGALDLAGARAAPFRVWLEDWQLAERTADDGCPAPSGAVAPAARLAPLCLSFSVQDAVLRLALTPMRALILQGENGYSVKSGSGRSASHYYSVPGLAAHGELRRGGMRVPVTGRLWMDREWSSAVLEDEQTGWDWFSLQLDDGRDLTLFRVRATVPERNFRYGLVVDGESGRQLLAPSAWRLEALETFTDEAGVRWPVAWVLTLGEERLRVEPLLRDQVMRTTVRYWEGAVKVSGTASGLGYLEMTGYGAAEPSR